MDSLANLASPQNRVSNAYEQQMEFQQQCMQAQMFGYGSSPVYGPSFATTHQQFVDFKEDTTTSRRRPPNTQQSGFGGRQPTSPTIQQRTSIPTPPQEKREMDSIELQHQRLEEFAALQQQLAQQSFMPPYASAGQGFYAAYLQAQMHGMMNPYGNYNPYYYDEAPGIGMPMSMPEAPHMPVYHPSPLPQPQPQPQPQQPAPLQKPLSEVMTPHPIAEDAPHSEEEPAAHRKESCSCVHCKEATKLMMMTPARSVDNSSSAFPTPESFTPANRHSSNYDTPPRRTKPEWRYERSNDRYSDRNSERRPERRSERRSAAKPSVRNEVEEPVAAPTRHEVSEGKISDGTIRCRVVLTGHFGRKFIAKSHVTLSVGDHVVFEGDRGEDLGCVSQVSRFESDSKERIRAIVYRLASIEEITMWKTSQTEEAAAAVESATEAVKTLRLPMTVRCASFQFDRKKLTFFYDSNDRVDFRRFLSEMYNKFRCRIWMERADELEVVPPAGGELPSLDEVVSNQ